ncbi:unnamed protein product, partial [Mesorhabditis spiculigera]
MGARQREFDHCVASLSMSMLVLEASDIHPSTLKCLKLPPLIVEEPEGLLSTQLKSPGKKDRPEISGPITNPAMRMAGHLEGSPGPLRQGPVLRPPQNAFDQNVMKNCVEELRRKRLQTADELLGGEQNEGASGQSRFADGQLRTRTGGGSWRGSREQRLSVPSISDDHVINSARALREKFGRTDAGELRVINEGLITPVVRRKDFSAYLSALDAETTSSDSCEDRNNDAESHDVFDRNRKNLEAILDPSRRPDPGFPRR